MSHSPQLGAKEKVAIVLGLTGIGGFVDAVGYIALFQIFTANMSGNSVHVGMYLGQGDLSDLMRPASAVGAFIAGMVLTRIAIEVATRTGTRRIASFTLSAEAILLLLFAQATPRMHLGQIVDLHSPVYFALVAMLAFAMGVQTVTLTHVGPLTVYTTFVTGTLTKFAESFTEAIFWGYDRLRRIERPIRDGQACNQATGRSPFSDTCCRVDLLLSGRCPGNTHEAYMGVAGNVPSSRRSGVVCTG